MEAFGNAKTVHNSNSSRFGKFVQLSVCRKGNIQGGRVVDCILLRSGLAVACGSDPGVGSCRRGGATPRSLSVTVRVLFLSLRGEEPFPLGNLWSCP